MNKTEQARYEARARIIKALAHPTRLMMVEKLSQREHCVCELTDMAGADISTVSKHLSILKQAGIVSDDRRGLMVFYRLKTLCALNFLDCVEKIMKQRMKEQMALIG